MRVMPDRGNTRDGIFYVAASIGPPKGSRSEHQPVRIQLSDESLVRRMALSDQIHGLDRFHPFAQIACGVLHRHNHD